jgi:hypothetical protein
MCGTFSMTRVFPTVDKNSGVSTIVDTLDGSTLVEGAILREKNATLIKSYRRYSSCRQQPQKQRYMAGVRGFFISSPFRAQSSEAPSSLPPTGTGLFARLSPSIEESADETITLTPPQFWRSGNR